MSRQFRLRATGVVLGALFVVGPLVLNGTAQAEIGGADDLVFRGDGRSMFGLSCVAEHGHDGFTVESGSTVRVVNNTGHDADLQLNGVSQGTLADHSSTDVLFRRGPVEVMLTPDCAFAGPSVPAVVTVASASPSASPTPTPTATVTTPVSTTPTAVSPSPRPSRSTAVTAQSNRPVPRATADRDDPEPQRMTRPRTDNTNTTGTGAEPSPTVTPAETEAPLALDVEPTSSGPVLAAPEINEDGEGASGAAAEPVAALDPAAQRSPVGLLALAATICLAGVTAAAIRAIVAQRASRATIA